MKYDYSVKDIYGHDISCGSFNEAKQEAQRLLKDRPDCDPIIDQYSLTDFELTGVYWCYKAGQFVKNSDHQPLPDLFKGLTR